MKRIIYLLLLIPLVALTSCNNDDNSSKDPVDQLPPPTQSGKYTFGCLVNGEVMIPNNTNYMSAIYQGGGIQISGNTTTNDRGQSMTFLIMDPLVVNQTYELTNIPIQYVTYTKYSDESICWYEFEDTFDGWIKFSKIDRINQIVSGTFEYSTVTENCDTIRVTNGRFDMPYTS